MNSPDMIALLEIFFFLYLIGVNTGYFILNLVSISYIVRYRKTRTLDDLPRPFSGFEPRISILVPAYNEELTVVTTVRALLQMTYPEYEIIVINDGSNDRTLAILIDEFSLVPEAAPNQAGLATKPIRAAYSSTAYPFLRLLDKENGGKADALNAGINASCYGLLCSVDADSVIQRGSLRQMVYHFMEDPSTVASGGTVRVANGCEIKDGLLEEMSFHLYPGIGHIISLFLAAFLENFWYRQLNSIWRMEGILGWLSGKKVRWGEMKRTGSTGFEITPGL